MDMESFISELPDLSIDLANQFPAKIINFDKMQVYKRLDTVTNKITEEEKSGIPHHLLGVVNPCVDFIATNFCNLASLAIESICTRGVLPIIVGGSNSYIEALVDDEDFMFRSKYDCYFLWLDVSMPVPHGFVSKRVDQMVKKGMVDEVRKIFDPEADYSRLHATPGCQILLSSCYSHSQVLAWHVQSFKPYIHGSKNKMNYRFII